MSASILALGQDMIQMVGIGRKMNQFSYPVQGDWPAEYNVYSKLSHIEFCNSAVLLGGKDDIIFCCFLPWFCDCHIIKVQCFLLWYCQGVHRLRS